MLEKHAPVPVGAASSTFETLGRPGSTCTYTNWLFVCGPARKMIAAAKVHPSHFHVVAASVLKGQDEIRSQINTLINDPNARESAQHEMALAARKRITRFLPPGFMTSQQLLLMDTPRHTVCRSPTTACRRNSIKSLLPPQLFDLWPRILGHLLQRTVKLRQLLERVNRIFTRDVCAGAVWRVMWTLPTPNMPSQQWAAMIAAGVRDEKELQLLLERLFSNIHGGNIHGLCRYYPTPGWYRTLADAAAIKGWQLPAIRILGDFDRGGMTQLAHGLEKAGFRSETLCRPWYNPQINPNAVIVTNPGRHIEALYNRIAPYTC